MGVQRKLSVMAAVAVLVGCSSGPPHQVTISAVQWVEGGHQLRVTTSACESPRVTKTVEDRTIILSASGRGTGTCSHVVGVRLAKAEMGLQVRDAASGSTFWLGHI